VSQVHYTSLADADIDDITEYFAPLSPAKGLRVIKNIRDTARIHAGSPLIGRSRHRLRPGLKSFVAEGYVVYFRIVTGGIEVVRVVHGARRVTRRMFGNAP
jgi:toxin ParE1/3/4